MQRPTNQIDAARPTGSRLWCAVLAFVAYFMWPAGAIAAAYALELIEHGWELAFLFSGLLPFVLLPAQLVFQFSDSVVAVAIVAIWFGAWVLATALFLRRPRRWAYQWLFIGIVCGLSLMQSMLGLIMLVGKGV